MTYEEDLERVDHKLKWDGIPVPKVVAKVVAIRQGFPEHVQRLLTDKQRRDEMKLKRAAWLAVGSLCLLFWVSVYRVWMAAR